MQASQSCKEPPSTSIDSLKQQWHCGCFWARAERRILRIQCPQPDSLVPDVRVFFLRYTTLNAPAPLPPFPTTSLFVAQLFFWVLNPLSCSDVCVRRAWKQERNSAMDIRIKAKLTPIMATVAQIVTRLYANTFVCSSCNPCQ